MDVLASPQGKLDHADTGGGVGFGVNQDEGSSCAICLIGIKGNRAVERYIAGGDIVQRQRVHRLLLVIVHIDPEARLGQCCGGAPPFCLHDIGAPRQHFALVHPDDGGPELVSNLGRFVGCHKHVTARDVELALQGHAYRLTGARAVLRHLADINLRDCSFLP